MIIILQRHPAYAIHPPSPLSPPPSPPALSLSLSLSLQTKACSEASRQPQRLITNHSPMGRPVGDASPTTLGANQVVSKEKLGANQVLTPFVGKTYRERGREREHHGVNPVFTPSLGKTVCNVCVCM